MKHLHWFLFLAVAATTACETIKPYEKEYLLHPLMDDAKVSRLQGDYTTKTRPKERLASAGAGSGSTSCPTCGGK